MITLTHSIVDKNKTLVGFVINGTYADFNEVGYGEVTRAISLQHMKESGFRNKQITVTKNGIKELGDFKVNQLSMKVYTDKGYVDIGNEMELVGRYVQNNQNIGFDVRFSDGSVTPIKYNNLIVYCRVFKPSNFVVRTGEDGVSYIAGKANVLRIEELPQVEIGERAKKVTKGNTAKKEERIIPEVSHGLDVSDLFETVHSLGGCVIKLPDVGYVKSTLQTSVASSDFINLRIGEVASPYLSYNSQKLNLNAGFKQVGIVNVTNGAQTIPVTTYTDRTKSIVSSGENYIGKLGVAIPVDKANEFVSIVGSTLALREIIDESFEKHMAIVINTASLKFFEIDCSNLDMIRKDKVSVSILTQKELYDLLYQRELCKIVGKAVGARSGLLKMFKDTYGDDAVYKATNKEVFGIFSTMTDDWKQACSDAGINIYNGSFTKRDKVESEAKEKETDRLAAKPISINIDYNLDFANVDKITAKDMIDMAKASDYSKLPKAVVDLLAGIVNIKEPAAMLEEAKKFDKDCFVRIAAIERQLWMHCMAMAVSSGFKAIHSHDYSNWELDITSRSKKAERYRSKSIPGMYVDVSGINLMR